MPAPSFLKGLPKPVLFGLYGAIGGLLGALVFAEPLYQLLEPAKSLTGPQVAVTASKDVEVFFGKTNTFTVQIDRAGFDGLVTVTFPELPTGIAIKPVEIVKGKTEAEVTINSTGSTAVAGAKIKIVATGDAGDKKPTAETSMTVAVADPARPAQADILFVIDVTASMNWAIDGLRDGIGGFAGYMRDNKIDFRVGVLAFRDPWVNQPSQLLTFGKAREPFTSDDREFASAVGQLRAFGGGDDPEGTLDAVVEACGQPFRKSATKALLVITDNPPKPPFKQGRPYIESETASVAEIRETAAVVKSANIDFVHLVLHPQDSAVYRPIQDAAVTKGSRLFELRKAAAPGGKGFNELVNDFSRDVAVAAKAKNPEGKAKVAGDVDKASVKSLQSSGSYAAGSEVRLLILSGVWAGAVAALVCLALLSGQTHYLRGTLPAGNMIAAGVLGGLVAGLVGGASGYGLYLLSPGGTFLDALFRIFGWALLGGLAGIGLSLFIPNLKWKHGLAGGALGGAVGAVGFIAVSAIGDIPGRLIGGLILGLCIGLMVAIVEAAFRTAWLEVRFGARETITVNLGPEPIKVGGDAKACTVWARGAASVALRYFIRNGTVIREDAPTRTETVVGEGDTLEVGNVTVTVRTGSSPSPRPTLRPTAPPPARPPSPPPVRAEAPKPTPMSLDDDDGGFGMPMPMSPAAPAAPPKAAPPPAAASPKPAASKPVAGPRDPNACPGCGKIIPGRPGSRYCMLCDHTY